MDFSFKMVNFNIRKSLPEAPLVQSSAGWQREDKILPQCHSSWGFKRLPKLKTRLGQVICKKTCFVFSIPETNTCHPGYRNCTKRMYKQLIHLPLHTTMSSISTDFILTNHLTHIHRKKMQSNDGGQQWYGLSCTHTYAYYPEKKKKHLTLVGDYWLQINLSRCFFNHFLCRGTRSQAFPAFGCPAWDGDFSTTSSNAKFFRNSWCCMVFACFSSRLAPGWEVPVFSVLSKGQATNPKPRSHLRTITCAEIAQVENRSGNNEKTVLVILRQQRDRSMNRKRQCLNVKNDKDI